MKEHRKAMWVLGLLLMAFLGGWTHAQESEITFTVHKRVLHTINPRIFGHFMEKPSWGEIGPEGALVPGTRKLQPEVLERLHQMKIPILRFPGGTRA